MRTNFNWKVGTTLYQFSGVKFATESRKLHHWQPVTTRSQGESAKLNSGRDGAWHTLRTCCQNWRWLARDSSMALYQYALLKQISFRHWPHAPAGLKFRSNDLENTNHKAPCLGSAHQSSRTVTLKSNQFLQPGGPPTFKMAAPIFSNRGAWQPEGLWKQIKKLLINSGVPNYGVYRVAIMQPVFRACLVFKCCWENTYAVLF
jgi:hypothetical protein